LFSLCRVLQPAILHSRGLSGLDALLPARFAGVQHCVHGEHGWNMTDLHGENRKSVLLRRLHWPLIRRYIAVSKDIERYLAKVVGIPKSRITQIYNGVDTDCFSPRPTKLLHFLPPHLRGQNFFVIGTVGRIQAVKDQATLIRAFAELVRTRSEFSDRIRLAVVGDGPLLAELRRLANFLGIADRVWLPGALKNIPEVLRAFDLFALPSLSEGISNTILEAMATGLPAVATDVGGNPELVINGTTGILVPVGDRRALAEAMAMYICHPEKIDEHGRAARQRAEAEFSIQAMVNAYSEVYESLLNSGSRARVHLGWQDV